jgi:hypothetical protein
LEKGFLGPPPRAPPRLKPPAIGIKFGVEKQWCDVLLGEARWFRWREMIG